MDVVYQLELNADYCRQLIERYYQQRPLLVRPISQFALLFVILVVAGVYGAAAGNRSGVGSVLIGLLVCLGGYSIVNWAVFNRLRARADFGSKFEVTLANDGITAKGAHVNSHWQWAAYPQAARFADGLLLQRPGVIRWLPDTGLVRGTADEATELVAAMCKLRNVA